MKRLTTPLTRRRVLYRKRRGGISLGLLSRKMPIRAGTASSDPGGGGSPGFYSYQFDQPKNSFYMGQF